MVRVVKKKRGNTWFYGLLVLFVVAGYVAVQWAMFYFSSCQGSAAWEWSKVPPGYVCESRNTFGPP